MMRTQRPLFGLLAGALLAALAVPLLAQDSAKPVPAEASVEDDTGVGGSAFSVTDIEVDSSGKSPEEARIAGYRVAVREAWPQLWARLTGYGSATAPKLPDSTLEAMVSAVEVQNEKFSTSRYIATLGIVFDRNRAGERLPASARILQSRPLLLLPVLVDGGVRTIYEGRSPWQAAWARFGTEGSPIDYIRAKGTPGDAVLLTSWQARRDDRALWRTILARYGAENLIIAEAFLDRSYPGGPITGTFLARYGPDATLIERFRLRAGGAGEIDTMLDTAVRRLDAAYARALQAGKLSADDSLTLELAPIDASVQIADAVPVIGTAASVLANVVTPNAATWNSFDSAIAGVPGVRGFTVVSLAIGGTSQVRINHDGDLEMLRYALDQRGLRLEPGESGYRLRRREADEAPLPQPLRASPTESANVDSGPRDLLPAPVGAPDQ
jgi:hypothetical protein